jgi:hypothetical protein
VEQSGFFPSPSLTSRGVECFHRIVFVDACHCGCGAQSPVSSMFLPVAESLCGDLPAILIYTDGLDLLLDLL